jgi:hypothetical protein
MVRSSALTLVADPRMAFDVDFDNLVAVCMHLFLSMISSLVPRIGTIT